MFITISEAIINHKFMKGGVRLKMKKAGQIFLVILLVISLASCDASGIFNDIKNAFTVYETKTENNNILPEADTTVQRVTNDITVGVLGFDTYNPLVTASSTVKEICGFVFEPLFGFDSSFRTKPCLGESYIIGSDGQSMTITIKKGVTWHDSSPFTVDDVLYTINYIRMNITNYTHLLEPVSEVWKQDERNLCIKFSRPVPDAVALFSFPVIKKNSVKESFKCVGTGPFMVLDNSADTSLVAYDGYHNGRAAIDCIYVKSIPDKEKYISLFNANEINIATSEIIDMTAFMPKSNAKVYDYLSNNMVIAGFNAASSKLNDAKTRVAISKLIDRDTIVSDTYFSRAVAAEYPVNPWSWLNPDKRKKLRADDSSALSLLTDAGWEPDNRGIYFRWDGKKASYLTLDITVNSDSEKKTIIAQKIADKLTSAGIPARVKAYSGQEFINAVSQGNYEMFIGEIELMPNNDLTSAVGTGRNYFNYSNSDVDVLLAQMGTVQLEEDIKTVAHTLYSKLYEEMPFAPLCFTKESIVTGAKIKSGVNPSTENYVRETQLWSVQ